MARKPRGHLETTPHNEWMQRTRPASNGASPLIHVFDGPQEQSRDAAVRRVAAISTVWATFLACACFSPSGAYRELRSDRNKPSAADLAGTWRVTHTTAAHAANTGLSLADVEAGFISLRADGTCSGDMYEDPCGHHRPSVRRTPSEACQWSVSTYDKPTIMLTFGQGNQTSSFELHRLESDPPILWQYICDPDWADYLEFQRAAP